MSASIRSVRKLFTWGVVLFSIILNIFLVGYIVGKKTQEFVTPFMPPEIGGVQENLSPEHHALFLERMKELRSGHRQTFGEFRRTRQEIMEILTAPSFDPEAYELKVDELRDLMMHMQARRKGIVKELGTQFTQQEREVLAQYLLRSPGGPGRFGKRGRHRMMEGNMPFDRNDRPRPRPPE